jgi:predicted metal-dependent hydrolase
VHLEIRNHSREYWQRVKDIMPNYKVQKEWLRENVYLLTY